MKKLSGDVVWDVLVIGGGATGLGIALDAVTRGYKTLLVEQNDFAKGTSSRSTKLVHGGVRYLAQGNIKLVHEASIERGLLCRNAPHLVKDQLFFIPVYTYFDLIKYTAGLKLYDWISGRFTLGSSLFVSRKKIVGFVPGIKTKALLGGVVYHDGLFDDARLAINLAQTFIENGGCAINYVRVTGLLKNSLQKTEGAMVVDKENNNSYYINAKAVVNATGVFVDDVLKMDNSAASKTIRASQGIHIVLDKKFYPSDYALMIPKTSDGRILFAVPWYNKVVVGTTDTPVDEILIEPVALEKEINFILETAASYLLQKPERKDVLSVFAGLRPLAAGNNGEQKTKEISRSHKMIVSSSNLFTMLGGKWTTYRKMGEDMMNYVEKHLQWLSKKSITSSLPIHGHTDSVDRSNSLNFYGKDAIALQQNINKDGDDWISERLKIHSAQVIWAVKYEMARTVEDVLSRRTRALLLDAEESICIAPKVAKIMADTLQKNQQWIDEQLASYSKLASHYILNKKQTELK